MKSLYRKPFVTVLLIGVSFFVAFGIMILFQDEDHEKATIAVVLKDMKHPSQFWQVVKRGIDIGAAEHEIDISYYGASSESDLEGQISALDSAIQMNPSVIILASIDYRLLVPKAEEVKGHGIKLILIDSGLEGIESDSFIATDNRAAGEKAGMVMRDLISTDSQVAVINYAKGSQTAIEREQGVIAGLGFGADIYYCNDDISTAMDIVKKLVQNNSDLRGFIGLNEKATIGITRAIDELDLSGKYKVVGFDNSTEEVTALQKGTLDAIIVQKPFNMGYLAINTAVKSIRNKDVSPWIDTGSDLITKENMADMEVQKILFPFTK